MIIRLWHGWARGENGARYQKLLNEDIAPAIMARGLRGLRRLDVLRRVPDETPGDDATEFVTAMTFDDQAAVTAFAGPDSSASVVPPAARALLDRHDLRSQHYQLVGRHDAHPGAVEITRKFLAALGRRDLAELTRLLAEDVVVDDAHGRLTGARSVVHALGEFARDVNRVDVVAVFGDDTEAVVVYEMHTRGAVVRGADHVVVADGRIVRRSVTRDRTSTQSAEHRT